MVTLACGAAPEAAVGKAPMSAAHRIPPAPEAESKDCLALGDLSERETCFATSDDFRDCPETDVRCAPYKKMYLLDQTLKTTNELLLSLANENYASYRDGDPSYLADLDRYLKDSDASWRSYRDASCYLEQFAQGMSRQEIAHLSESCRVRKTQERIKELKSMIESQSFGKKIPRTA